MKNQNILVGIGLVIAIALSLFSLTQTGSVSLGGRTADDWRVGQHLTVDGSSTFSGSSDFTGEANLRDLVFGDADGSSFTSSATTTALTAANVCDNSIITITPTGANNTTTLPAATSTVADCLTADGDMRLFTIINGGTTSTITIATSTGDLIYISATATSTTAADYILNGGDWFTVRLVRTNSTTTAYNLQELIKQ